jgi:hypothetical protein
MINHLSQPQLFNSSTPSLFGGKRARQWVLTGENEYAYPSTLAVGSRGFHRRTLGGSFWGDENGDLDGAGISGGKKYKVKSFINDVNALGKLIPKSTRDAMTDKANSKIAGAGISGGKKYKVKSFINDVNALGKLIPKSTREAITDKANSKIAGAGISGGKKYKVKSFINDVNALGKLIPKSTREAITDKANSKIAGAGRKRRSKKMDIDEWLNGGALSSQVMKGSDNEPYIMGGKKYKVKSFVNDVNALGKLIPKSTREAMTDKANSKIAGAGRGRPVSERGKLIKKIMGEMGMSLGQASKYIKEEGLM